MLAGALLISAVIAYFIGNFSSATTISRRVFHKDVRDEGSGSAGATNMFRTFGPGWGFLTLFLDALKGFVAYYIGYGLGHLMTGGDHALTVASVAGVFAVVGHNWPLLYGFKGGKGVAATLGVMLAAAPLIGLGGFAIAIIAVLLTNYMSIGSMAGNLFAFIFSLIFEPIPTKLLMLALFLLDILQHRDNIKRLINGRENPMMSQSLLEKLSGKKKK